jgi:hypothetical protein
MTSLKAAPVRRPRRSNQSLSIVRGIKTLKTIYWTTSRLRKLLPGVFSTAREEHFGRAIAALKSWPERTKEQIIDDGSRINPRRLRVWPKLKPGQDPDIGYRTEPAWCWSWPKSMETLMREYADRAAPEDGIDTDKLRKALKGMDRRTRERFMGLVVEMDLPPPRETKFDWHLLSKISRAHSWLMEAIRRDPDPIIREIDIAAPAEVPNPNWLSWRWPGNIVGPAVTVKPFQDRVIAPHVPMRKEARELKRELQARGRRAVIIDVLDDAGVKNIDPDLRVRRHLVRKKGDPR